ncbi:peptidoglycan-binding protein [Streptomyces sp. NPDC086081]|uniref:peptidoglycan-binding domain-containing protein n=1 Tax=Streptomyces sp. NPDC086081 TaxID=3365749 RepID=UPI0038137C13
MSTPSEPRPPHGGPPLEPIRVLRPRRTDALAELMREYHAETGRAADGGPAPDGDTSSDYESVTLPRSPAGLKRPPHGSAGRGAGSRSPAGPGTRTRRPAVPEGPARAPAGSEARTEELPAVAPAHGGVRAGPGGAGLRRAAVAVAVVAAAVLGFGGALLLGDGGGTADDAAPAPRPPGSAAPVPGTVAPSPAPPTAAVDPDGRGTLREGAAGPEVAELQARLLRIPDVYRDGSTSGRYDSTLTAAVARFQLWYGIRGDETGVYGDDTRAALESRTAPVAG